MSVNLVFLFRYPHQLSVAAAQAFNNASAFSKVLWKSSLKTTKQASCWGVYIFLAILILVYPVSKKSLTSFLWPSCFLCKFKCRLPSQAGGVLCMMCSSKSQQLLSCCSKSIIATIYFWAHCSFFCSPFSPVLHTGWGWRDKTILTVTACNGST